MPEPGPNSKLQSTEPGEVALGPIPSPPAPLDGVDLSALTADEIRARLDARQRDLKYHIAARKHEAATVADDVLIDGRPFMDIVRAQPWRAVGLSAAVGGTVGALLGVWAKRRNRPDEPEDHIDFIRVRLAYALDDAARRVAAGADTDDAIRRSRQTVPVAYGDAGGQGAADDARHSHGVLSVVVKTALGFAAKAAVDAAVRRYTPHEDTFAALGDAAD